MNIYITMTMHDYKNAYLYIPLYIPLSLPLSIFLAFSPSLAPTSCSDYCALLDRTLSGISLGCVQLWSCFEDDAM